ncbi:MAG: ERF family protein [Roseburia sp.]
MAETAVKLNIYQSISKCMEEIGAVRKNDVNKTQNFKYRGIDAVMNAINPALVKNHVFIVPEVLEQKREERTSNKGNVLIYSVCKIKFTFFAEDGSSITAVTIGEGMDSGDKATNKAMAIAFKYACFQVFCIPTEEMTEPDTESHNLDPNKPQQAVQHSEPASVEQLRKISEFSDAYAHMCQNATATDIMETLKQKFDFSSTSDLSSQKADAVIKQLETWYQKKKEIDA